MFDSTASVHSQNLRESSNNIFIPKRRTEAGKRAFSYRGAVLWNSLPSDLKNRQSRTTCSYFCSREINKQKRFGMQP